MLQIITVSINHHNDKIGIQMPIASVSIDTEHNDVLEVV